MVRVLKFVLFVLGGLLAAVLAAVGLFWVFLSLRPSAETVQSSTVLSVELPFELGRALHTYVPFVDYMLVDGPRLYAGNTTQGLVGIVDTVRSHSVATIDGLGAVHGVAIDRKDGLGFATDSTSSSVYVFDPSSRRVLGRIPVDDDPDAILYDEKLRLVYVATHDAGIGDVIDPGSRSVKARIVLGGKAEYAQSDPATGLIYQNVSDTDEVVVVNPVQGAITARYKLGGGIEPTGLALDSLHHRLFVTGFGRKALVLNADTGAVISALPIGYGSDGVAYDPSLGRIYVANGLSATMTVIRQETPDRYRRLEDAPTHFFGHSVVVDPVTHRVYIAFFGRIAVYDARLVDPSNLTLSRAH